MNRIRKQLVVVGLALTGTLTACTAEQPQSRPAPRPAGTVPEATPAGNGSDASSMPSTSAPPTPELRLPTTSPGAATRPPAPPARSLSRGPQPAFPSTTATRASAVPPVPAAPVPPGSALDSERWKPTPGTPWQWQLTGVVDTTIDVPVYDIDLFDADANLVASLHAAGRRVICYINAGAYEDWRPDASRFPRSVLGKENGWAGERWLDIRRLDILGPIIESRLDRCQAQGFDGVEPDNVDGHLNDTGFPLQPADQLVFNRFVADAAKARGLAVGLKNDIEQIPELVDRFDFALNEECARYEECNSLLPFIRAGKAVFHVEYDLDVSEFCPGARRLGLSSMRKRRDLKAWRQPC